MLAKRMKKTLAFLLALIMVLGLTPLSAFAANEDRPGGLGAYVDLSQQDPNTSSGYKELEKDEKHEIALQNKDGKDVLWADKEMKPVSGESDTYDITLTTKTTQEIKEIITSPDTAVVLVFDVSGSMTMNANKLWYTNPDGTSEKITRLEAVHRVGVTFLNDYVKSAENASNDVKRMISVASFAFAGTTDLGWTDVARGMGSASDPNSPLSVISGVENTGANGGTGTDISTGLNEAIKLLNDDQVKEYTHKYVILLSDGAPSYSSSVAPTETAADTIKNDLGATLFTIGFGVTDENVKRTYTVNEQVEHRCNKDYVHYHKTSTVESKGYVGGVWEDGDGWKFTGKHVGYTMKDVQKSETLTVDAWLQNYIASPVSPDGTKYAYTVDDADQLKLAFGNILTTISKDSKAWSIEDPIGSQFTFQGLVSGNKLITDKGGMEDLHVTRDDDGKLTWTVLKAAYDKKEQISDDPLVNCYTYTLTYRVKLDTAAKGFETNKQYPANGKTTLYYTVDDEGNLGVGDTKPQDLYVPTAWGTVPTVSYTVEYYKWDRVAEEYVLQEDATESGTGKLWTDVTLWEDGAAIPAKYADKYASAKNGYYSLTSSDRTIQLKPDTKNVLKLYYDPTPVDVTVEHYLTTVEKTDDGVVTTGPEKLDQISTPQATYYKGDLFSADDPEDLLLTYPIDTEHTKPADYQNVKLDKDKNVIPVYYINDKGDGRTELQYTVNYFYRSSTWAVDSVTKRMTEQWPEYPETPGLSYSDLDGRHGDEVPAPLTDKETHDGDYVLDEEATTATSIVLDKNKDNVLNVYLQQEGNRPDEDATLQITHVYQRMVVNGGLELDGSFSEYDEPISVYAGEEYGAEAKMSYTDGNGNTFEYDSYTTNQTGDALTATMVEGENEIVITYVRDARVPTDVTVEHYFYQNEWEIGEDGDADIVTPEEYTDFQTEELEGPHYVGGSATATSWPLTGEYEGYSLSNPDDLTLTDLKDSGNVIKLYYYRDPLTNLDGADVTVTHTYNTYTTYINDDGATVENESSSNSKSEEKVEGMVGEWFMADPDFTDDNGDSEGYYQVSPTKNGTEPEKVTLKTTNGEFPFTYERYVDARQATSYTVQPILVTYSRSIDPATGETVVTEVERKLGTAWSSEDDAELTVYAKQKISITPTAFDPDQVGSGYEFDANDKETTQAYASYQLTADADSNIIYLAFAMTEDDRGPQVDVVVRNHYTFDTYRYQNGQKVAITDPDDEIVEAAPVKMYLDQFFTTTGKGTPRPNYDLDVDYPVPAEQIQITEADLDDGVFYVDFYWYGSIDKTDEQKASVQVIHHYTEIDLDGDKGDRAWTVGDLDEDILTGWYATQTYVAGYNFQNGLFDASGVVEVDPEGATDQNIGVTLEPGLNVIHIYYERTYHSRVSTNVEITHNYYAMDTFAFAEMDHAQYLQYVKEQGLEPEYSRVVSVTGREQGAYVGAEFTAARLVTYTVDEGTENEKTYTYVEAGAEPEGGVIASLLAATQDAPKPNRITISYIRDFDSRQATSVTVEHRYYTEDTYTGSRREDKELAEQVVESTFEQGVWVGNRYTAKELLKTGYDRETKDADMVIESLLPGGSNTITVTYLKYISSDPGSYTVNVYHVDGAEGAPQQATLSTYNSLNNRYKVGAAYTTQAVPAQVLESMSYKQLGEPTVEGQANRDGVVNVTYTYGPKADVALTVNYDLVDFDDEGKLFTVKTLETSTSSHKEGYEYDFLPAKEIAGYVYLGVAEGSAPAAGKLELGKDVTVTLQYYAESYPFRVDFINDYTGAFIETVWSSDMMAPFGTTLVSADVAPYFGSEIENWQNYRLPSGYHISKVEYPTIAVSPKAQEVEGNEGEDVKYDPSPITNIVAVHYDYTPDGGDGDDDRPTRYTITVEYRDEATGETLKSSERRTASEGSSYDVSDLTRRAISGYSISSIDGDVRGRATENVTITVWYDKRTSGGGDKDPGGDTTPPDNDPGNVDITDNETPLGDGTGITDGTGGQPAADPGDGTGEGTGSGDTIIVDEHPPLGKLPQTGTMTTAADPTVTLGSLALAASLAAAGLAFVISRKKEEDAE